ncbi:MAG: HEPN domain-containing protein [bacterium]
MDKENVIKYWLESAKNDQETAEDLFRAKKYTWSLFIWQLVVEKQLKARLVENFDDSAPTIHDLYKLAKKLGLKLSVDQIKNLKEITKFNINARYEDYKHTFYKQATRSFTIRWIKIIKDFLLWLKKQS